MEKILPTVPISDLRKDQAKVLAMIKRTPVVLMNRGDVAGVFVKVEQWNQTLDELRQLRRIIQADKHFAEMRAGDFIDMTEELTTKAAA